MKIAFLTNILTPYRFFFNQLYKALIVDNGDMRVFVMTDSLPLRPWNFHKVKREYTVLLKGAKFFFHDIDFLLSFNIRKEVSAFSPDVLIVAGSWTYPTTWEVMLDKRIKRNTKTLFWAESHNHTGIANSTKAKPTIRKIKQNLINRFDGFCLPGKYALETVSQIVDLNYKTIIRLPNLVDNKYYEEVNRMRGRKDTLRIKKGIPVDRFVFFTPARMRDLKGQLPIFKNVIDVVTDKPVTFVLAGEGPDKDTIEEIGNRNKIDIRIYDYQTQEQIREWLSIADAFPLPSLSDPNSLSNIEAAWAGLPLCISCYVGNGPELVEDGVNGVIFDTLDKDSVCEKIAFVLNQDESRTENERRVSHKKAEEGFEAEKESMKFINPLAEICGGWYEYSVIIILLLSSHSPEYSADWQVAA